MSAADDAIVQRYHVRMEWTELRAASCAAVVASAPEPARTGLKFAYEAAAPQRRDDGSYAGALVFRFTEIVIEAPRTVSWPGMNDADRTRAEAFRRALLHHEAGHVEVAEASLRALAQQTIAAPDPAAYADAVRAAGAAAQQRFVHDQVEYDRVTDHGRAQERAPGALAGRDTVLVCDER